MLHGLKDNHMDLFKNLLVSLIVHRLKLSPRKCQLFVKHSVYLGNVFHIEDGVITITPMKSRIEAIQKLEHPTTVKGCNSFCEVVNYLSLFCKDLQKNSVKPIYELTRKEQPFIWTEFHQKAFEHVKELLVKTPSISTCPDLVVDSFYIVTLQRCIQAVLFGKCRMENPDY